MTTYERLTAKIANQEKIVLSYTSDLMRLLSQIFFIVSLFSIALAFYFFSFSVLFIALSSVSLFVYLSFLFSLKKYVSASIVGEMLIVKNMYNKNKVTSLKSIRSISTKHFFGYNHTKISFKLDGTHHHICIVKKAEVEDLENEEIIRKVMALAS